MDLSEYVFRVQDLPMIISGVLLTLYIVILLCCFWNLLKQTGVGINLAIHQNNKSKTGFFRFIRICRIFGILDLQR